MGSNEPRVVTHSALADLAPWRAALAELNLASRRPSPFLTPEYLDAFVAHDEYPVAGSEPLLLLAFDGERLVGFLPLRRRPERLLGLRRTRIEFLTAHDGDRPSLVARPEDELRCAQAFYRRLARDHCWTLLELMEQDSTSPLYTPPALGAGFHWRRFQNNPNSTIRIDAGFDDWLHSLASDWRSKLARRARILLGSGAIELVSSSDRRAASALLELYLDVEARSWKVAARAGISRHPVRVELFRALLALDQPVEPVFHFLLRDGAPIAAFLLLRYGEVFYAMEMAFDQGQAELSPGNLLLLLAVRDAAARGARAVNLLGNYEYHKSRWRAVVTDTQAIQIYRRFSLHHLKSRVGELRRRLVRGGPSQREVEFNLSKPKAANEPPSVPVSEVCARRAAEVFGRLKAAGTRIERLTGEALVSALPRDFAAGSAQRAGPPQPRRRGRRRVATPTS